ncbi:FtsX-like permease family protein [Pantanalinema rosaneae CENA516]|uniref:FtsX-like permease family protein n=1 Tax=Pantanalinema rosaneae TaxID=1620701 RepID=UPI003D6DC912
MASIARKNLFEDIPRFLVAQAGIMFAVSLVTIQTGILNGFTRSTALLIDQSSADLWVGSEDMLQLEVTLPMPLQNLVTAREVKGVARAEALMIRTGLWRSQTGSIEPVRIYGFDPKGQLFAANWQFISGSLTDLTAPYTVLIDRASRNTLDLHQVGSIGRIGSLPAKLVGTVTDTQSIASSAYLFTSLENANAYATAGLTSSLNCRLMDGDIKCENSFATVPDEQIANVAPPKPLSFTDPITYILVRANSGQDLQELKQRLQKQLPGTRVYTQAEIADKTRTYWKSRTGVGFILGLGSVVGIIVGMVVVSQILYSSVADHIKEFGTLKAMGASDWVIAGIITEQALWMAILGYLPSMALCVGLGAWTMSAKGIMILITPATAIGILGVTIIMCVGSAMFAIQKVTRVDPAIVFKA